MSQFVVTNAGLAAAAAATPTGPYVNITTFRLGDNYSTPALATDTALAGTTVYTGVPASFSYYDATTVQINLEIPASAGPFDYGEIGLYMPGSVLFARMSYGALRTKSESSVSGYANTLRIKALLRLVQGPAVFNFAPNTQQTVLEVASFQVVQTPNDNPQNPMVIVHEPNDYQESVVIFKDSATLWNIANYTKIGVTTVTAAPSTTQVTAPFLGTLYTPASSRGRYLIQTTGGYIRQVSSISGTTATLSSSINTTALIGQTIAVYQSDLSRIGELYSGVSTLQSQVASMVFFLGTASLSGSAYTVSSGSYPPVGMTSVKFLSANPSSSTLNINGSGSRPLKDMLGNSLPAGAIAAGETKVVITDGTSYFVQDVSTNIKLPDFTGSNQSKTASGYQKLPGGLIFQWGQAPLSTGSNVVAQSVTFPIPFPNAVFFIRGGLDGNPNPTWTAHSCNETSRTLTGFVATIDTTDPAVIISSSSTNFNWIAVGW